MNDHADTTDARLDELLGVVEAERERRCREILDKAREEAREITRRAHRETRQRVHEAIAEERANGRSRIEITRAHIETRNRHRRHQALHRLLTRSLDRLDAAIAARWGDADTRAQWIEAAVRHALARLPQTDWRVVHPTGWPEAEREALRKRLGDELDGDARLEEDERLDAGLRIHAGASVLDATPAGLLNDRAAIQARLLVHLTGDARRTGEHAPS